MHKWTGLAFLFSLVFSLGPQRAWSASQDAAEESAPPVAVEREQEEGDDDEEEGQGEDGGDSEALDRITVTGSRLKRTDWEGALPVTVIDREMIERSGESSAAELLRNLSFNIGGSFRPQSGSSAQGVSTLSLRAIGSNRTLVLIDGRRLPKSPFLGNSQDLGVIPLEAIERIEILSDGASAVYGSDAIGGVVNIITRKDYKGFDLRIGGADPKTPLEGGGDRRELGLTFGYSGDRTSLTAGLNYNEREIIFLRENPWRQGATSIYGNNFTSVFPGGFAPFNWSAAGDPVACDFPDSAYFTVPYGGSVNGSLCAYDFTEVMAQEASSKTTSLFGNLNHRLSDDWSLNGSLVLSESASFGRFAPTPDSSHPAVGLGVPIPPDSLNNPTNPDSPLYDPAFGPPAPVHWWHRFDSLGPRDTDFRTLWTELNLGVQGFVGHFEITAGARISNADGDDEGTNFINRVVAAELIASGAYDLARPLDNPASALDPLRVAVWRDAHFEQTEVYASAAFDAFELPAGPVQMVFGAEHRSTDFQDMYDPLSEAGLVGGSAGNSSGAGRRVTAYYFESLFPILEDFEATFAARVDDYSDFGSDTSPKLSLRWRPLDSLVLRASYGEGFRAPGSNILSLEPSFSADTVNDPATCLALGRPEDCSVEIPALVIGNPELGAEHSTNINAGIVFAPSDWLNLTVDYYRIEITDLIRGFSSNEIVFREREGLFIPPGLGVQRQPDTGAIVQVIRGFGNEGTIDTAGFDVNAVFDWSFSFGRLQSIVQYSRLEEYRVGDGRDQVKLNGLPQDRGTLSTYFERGAWITSWVLNYIGDQEDVPTWVLHDVQLSWETPWDGRIVIGARNVFDKDPPIRVGNFGRLDYDFNLYSGYGRVPYIRYHQTF